MSSSQRMSPLMILSRSEPRWWSRCSMRPREKLSRTTTSPRPRSRMASTMWLPMNPAPPVINQRMSASCGCPKVGSDHACVFLPIEVVLGEQPGALPHVVAQAGVLHQAQQGLREACGVVGLDYQAVGAVLDDLGVRAYIRCHHGQRGRHGLAEDDGQAIRP